jgi:hypothetical protein
MVIKHKITADYSLYNTVGLSQQIAQACDFRVSVKLARTKNVNLNLFLQPPAYIISTSEVLNYIFIKAYKLCLLNNHILSIIAHRRCVKPHS